MGTPIEGMQKLNLKDVDVAASPHHCGDDTNIGSVVESSSGIQGRERKGDAMDVDISDVDASDRVSL